MTRLWRRLSTQLDTEHSVFRLIRERFESPRTGAVIDATIVDSADWVNILPLTPEEQVVLVRQFRFGVQRDTLEIPGGLLDPTEPPALAAGRELREETGYAAERIVSLGWVSPNPAFMRNRLHCFLAEGCTLAGPQEQDPGEDITVELRPLCAIDAMIARGELDHALAQLPFQRLRMLRQGHVFTSA